MRQRSENLHFSSGGGLLKRTSKRVVAFAASVAMVASMVPVVPMATAMADPSGAGIEGDGSGSGDTSTETEDTVMQNGATLITSETHAINEDGAYYIAADTTIGPDETTGNGIKIAENLNVMIYIPAGMTLTVTGANGTSKTNQDDKDNENTVGKAAIYLPESSKLTVSGQGTLKAQGGNAANGVNALSGGNAWQQDDHEYFIGGNGADGGHGGGGAGAGIGTDGGAGGEGGIGGAGAVASGTGDDADQAGVNGTDGQAGKQAKEAGTVVFAGNLTVDVQGGSAGTGGKGGQGGKYAEESTGWGTRVYSTAGGAGGGGGAGGEFAYGIGSGGAGGSGGGGGGGGGHYYDGTGGAAFTHYYWCGSEGGAAGSGITCGASDTSGTAGEKSQVSENAYKIGDELDMRCTSKPGASAAAATSVSASTIYTYCSSYADSTFAPTYAKDNNQGKDLNPAVITSASVLKSAGYYTVDVTASANGGVFDPDNESTFKDITVVPGAEPLKAVYSELTGNLPTRTGYNLTGFAFRNLNETAGEEFLAYIDKNWSWTGTDVLANPLYTGKYVSGAMAMDDSTLTSVLWTGFAGLNVVAEWQGIEYSITYNRNATWLTKHSAVAPKWHSTASDAGIELDTDDYTETGFRYTDSSKDEDKDQLAISGSMNSSDGYSWPTKPSQAYYLESSDSYRHLGWTTAVDNDGNAIGDFYPCGSKVNGLSADGSTVTLYAVWGDKDDIYSPTFTATDTTVPYDYSSDSAKVTIAANPYWGKNSEGNWGSYFVNVLYGETPTYGLSTKWQQYVDGEWKDVDTGSDSGYVSKLDDSSFTDKTKFDPTSEAYKNGDYCNCKLVSTLSVPTGLVAGANNEYRVIYTISTKDQDETTQQPKKTFTYTSGSVRFKVIKADIKGLTVSDTSGNDLTNVSGYSVDYDGKTHGIQIAGMEKYRNVLGANLVYYSTTDPEKVTSKAPSEPGEYYAVATFHCSDTNNYNVPANLVKTITIKKLVVDIPESLDDLNVIIDPQTGEAQKQSAFDEEYTSNALYTAEGYEATDAGSYKATFTLKDTNHYVWSNGSKAAIEVRYYIDSLVVFIGQEKVTVENNEYSLVWEGTNSKADGTVKHATLKSDLFGTDGKAAAIPDWALNWKDGRPYKENSAFFVYLCGDIKTTDLSKIKMLVGYDKQGNEISYLQIIAWMDGTESGKTAEIEGVTVVAKSFDDVAEFGVKDTSVTKVAMFISTGLKNVYVYGAPTTDFTISKADPAPSPSPAPVPDPEVIEIDVPSAYAGLVANGTEQAGIDEGTGYVLSGDYKATKAGTYTATVTPADGYVWSDGTSDAKKIEWTLAKASKQLVYNGKEQTGVAADAGYELDGKYAATDAGTYKAYITLKDGYKWADDTKTSVIAVKWSIAKANNPVKVKTKAKTVKYSKVKTKKATVKPVTVKGLAEGTQASFKKVKKNSDAKAYKALTVNKTTGKVTVKKGTKKGTYKLRYKVSVAGTANYNSFAKTVTVKVKVK